MKFYIGQNNNKHYEALVRAVVINIEETNLVIVLRCYEVSEEGGDEKVSETAKSYERKLVANNSAKVDAKGNYLPLGNKEQGFGEWDFFQNIAANVPVKVNDLIFSTLIKNRNRLMPDGLLPE